MAAISIENKLDAGEQPEQISRYQGALLRGFPGRTRVLAFLTPTGREPTTARTDSLVPAVAIGFDSILSGVKEARREAASERCDEGVLSCLRGRGSRTFLGLISWNANPRARRTALRYGSGGQEMEDQ